MPFLTIHLNSTFADFPDLDSGNGRKTANATWGFLRPACFQGCQKTPECWNTAEKRRFSPSKIGKSRAKRAMREPSFDASRFLTLRAVFALYFSWRQRPGPTQFLLDCCGGRRHQLLTFRDRQICVQGCHPSPRRTPDRWRSDQELARPPVVRHRCPPTSDESAP